MTISGLRDAAHVKGPDAFRTISEVADELDLPQHVLRFWETRFNQIKPMKRGGGRRYYRPEDVDLLRGIRVLLYGEGFTIRGVQRLLKEKGVGFVAAAGQAGSVQTVTAPDMDLEPAPAQVPRGAHAPAVRASAEPEDFDPELMDDEPPPVRQPRPAPAVAAPATVQRPDAPLSLSSDDRRRLQAALSELAEAKRLLDQAR
jgi:DNA-binding transcriptional MerR regulator